MSNAPQQFLSWLAAKQPALYVGIANKLRQQGGPVLNRPVHGAGMHGLGDASGDTSILDSITGALQSITSTVGTVSSDAALVQYNLNRAKSGLAPVTALPTAPAPTASQNALATVTSMFKSPMVLLGLGAVALGVGYLILSPSKGKK